MDPEIAGLLASGALSLVTAAATRAGNGVWDLVGPKLARLFGRGNADQEAAALKRLNKTAAALEQATDADRDRIRDQQRDAWRTRLEDFLDEYPEDEAQLKDLLEELTTKLPAEQASYVQYNTANNHSQAFGAQGPGSQVIVHQQPPASRA